MSPRKSVKSLFDLSLNHLIGWLKEYLAAKLHKINLFNDFDAARKEFLTRCKHGSEFIDEYFSGPLR